MTSRILSLAALVLAFGCLASSGCDDGGSPGVAPSGAGNSFSPATGTGADGAPLTELWWRHRINGGLPRQITAAGTLTFGDRLTRVLEGGTRRITTGDVDTDTVVEMDHSTTHLTQRFEETLIVGPPSAVTSQTLHQETLLSLPESPPLKVLATLTMTPAEPVVDVCDRTDLDQLPLGQFAEVTIMRTLTSTTSAEGRPDSARTETSSSIDHHQWTILQRLPALTVLGNSYRRVVKVAERVDSTDPATAQTTTVTNLFWLAAGIGVVRSEQGTGGFTVEPVLAELIETNLVR